MNNPIKFKIQNPTQLTPPMEIWCRFWQQFHQCSWDKVRLWCVRNLQQVSLKNTSTPRCFETSDAHHAYNGHLSYILQWSKKMLRRFNTQDTKGLQQIKTIGLEEEVFPPLAKVSRQTSMSTLNNMSETLLSSCMLKKHLIHHNEDPHFWRAQTRL